MRLPNSWSVPEVCSPPPGWTPAPSTAIIPYAGFLWPATQLETATPVAPLRTLLPGGDTIRLDMDVQALRTREPVLHGPDGHLRPRSQTKLVEHVRDVRFGGALADDKRLCDFPVAESAADQRGHFAFARGQSRWSGWCRHRRQRNSWSLERVPERFVERHRVARVPR